MQKQAIMIHQEDNVATAVANLSPDSTVRYFIGKHVKQLVLKDCIPLGHKFALSDIGPNEEIIKYGECIGSSLTAIKKGEHVHVHNIESNRARGDRNPQK